SVEFSQRDDYAQGGSGAGGGMHDGRQAGSGDSVFRAGAGRAGGAVGGPGGRAQRDYGRRGHDWRRDDGESRGAEALFYRIDGSGAIAAAAERGHGEESDAG